MGAHATASPKAAASPSGSNSNLKGNNESKFVQRYSQLATKSGSENDLTASTQTLMSSSLPRKVSFAGVLPNSFMTQSESSDSISKYLSKASRQENEAEDEFTRLVAVWHKLSTTANLGLHRYKMRSYADTILGEELIVWIYDNQGAKKREEAVRLAQSLLDGGFIEDVTVLLKKDGLGGPTFHPSVPYRLRDKGKIRKPSGIEEESEESIEDPAIGDMIAKTQPEWFRELQYDEGDDDEAAKKPLLPKDSKAKDKGGVSNDIHTMSSPVDHVDLTKFFKKKNAAAAEASAAAAASTSSSTTAAEDSMDGEGFVRKKQKDTPKLDEVYQKHQKIYLDKLLAAEKLSKEKWHDFIDSYTDEITFQIVMEPEINPWTNQIQMDIREIARVKRIPGGKKEDSRIITGEVFTNQVIRDGMPLELKDARVLLLQDSISFHRLDRLDSVANLHLVEAEYVKNVCNKIQSLKPDLILVQEKVCRLVQDKLAEAGICLVQNVNVKNLRRISRLFSTPLLESLDKMLKEPNLGQCGRYRSLYYQRAAKNLILLEDTQGDFDKGCCVILRGGSPRELTKVKRVLKQLLVVKVHAKYEKAFLLEECSQIDNFIVPYHYEMQVHELSLSPFIDLPPVQEDDPVYEQIKTAIENDEPDDIEEEEDEDEVDNDEHQTEVNGNSGVQARHLPALSTAILTTSYRDDVNVRNMLADFRASSRPASRSVLLNGRQTPKKTMKCPSSKETAPKFYKWCNKNVPMCFSSFLTTKSEDGGHEGSRYCIKPWTVTMSMYENTDVPLGAFLLSYCFADEYKCNTVHNDGQQLSSSSSLTSGGGGKTPQACRVSMRNHGRRFCLQDTCVTLIVQKVKDPVTKDDVDDRIVMWKYCAKCKAMTDVIPLSLNAWMMSFVMFLLMIVYETKMVRRDIVKCDHSLHSEQFTCFGRGNYVAWFKVEKLRPHEIRLPPSQILLPNTLPEKPFLLEELKQLSVLGSKLYGQINEKLIELRSECSCHKQTLALVTEMIAEQEVDLQDFREKQRLINEKLQTDQDGDEAFLPDVIGAKGDILALKVSMMKAIVRWKQKFAHFFDQKRKEDKTLASSFRSRAASGNLLDRTESSSNLSGKESAPSLTPSTATAISASIESNGLEVPPTATSNAHPVVGKSCSSSGASVEKAKQPPSTPKKSDDQGFWNWTNSSSSSSGQLFQIDNPFPTTLHPDLYVFPDIIVDESQPSSIIAYALSSGKNAYIPVYSFSVYSFFICEIIEGHKKYLQDQNKLTVEERDAVHHSKSFFDCQFNDQNGNSKFFCRAYFALGFDHFRKRAMDPQLTEEDFFSSLASCKPFQTSGGKSGATFFKTKDERFLLKQVNKHEMVTFQAIAKRYFDYMTDKSKRSAMAKIFGLYQVGFKNSATNNSLKLNVIVMENLFHGHDIEESFDLKGSVRNRLVDPTGNKVQGKELVLMDENLLRMASEKPFYVGNQTKQKLMAAVNNDAIFLCDIKVMDYSLLVGKDANTNELVVGIIDYLRPFSFDKMIESQAKKGIGYFQGNAEDPTVISPKAYQNRFIAAMENYFILLPNYWFEKPQNKDEAG